MAWHAAETMVVEVERTGPVVRVWILADGDEEKAREGAAEHLGTDALPEVVHHVDSGVFEVIYEAGDLT